jgi:hypothetical protein
LVNAEQMTMITHSVYSNETTKQSCVETLDKY